MRIVVLGGGFGGLRAASWLRKKLPARDHEVVLIANKDHFIFKPSLIWVPFYDREVEEITLPLGPLLKRAGVHYIQHHVAQVDPNLNHIVLQNGAILSFDYLLIATGGLPNWGAIPGLRGNTCSIYEVDDTLKTREKVNAIQSGDSIVVGVAQQNPLPSIAYEFLFELEDDLQKKGIKAPISLFTYEQNVLELAGTAVSNKMERLLAEKSIPVYRGLHLEKIRRGSVHLSNGKRLPCSFSFIVPPFKGADFVFASKHLDHEDGPA